MSLAQVVTALRDGWAIPLKVRVKAPAEQGKANKSAEIIIADALSVPNKNAIIIKGKTSTHKIIEITGINESDIYQRLSKNIN